MTRFCAIIDYVIVTAHAHSVTVDTWLLYRNGWAPSGEWLQGNLWFHLLCDYVCFSVAFVTLRKWRPKRDRGAFAGELQVQQLFILMRADALATAGTSSSNLAKSFIQLSCPRHLLRFCRRVSVLAKRPVECEERSADASSELKCYSLCQPDTSINGCHLGLRSVLVLCLLCAHTSHVCSSASAGA